MQKVGKQITPSNTWVGEKESLMNTQGINSGAHSATLKGKINALEVRQSASLITLCIIGNHQRHE